MRAYYKNFIIEQDETIDTELYYIRREDGKKFFTPIFAIDVYIDSLQGSFFEAINYVDAITA